MMRASHASHIEGSASLAWRNIWAATCSLWLAINPLTLMPDANKPRVNAWRAVSAVVAPRLVIESPVLSAVT